MRFWLRTSDADPGLGHKMRMAGLAEQLEADGHDVMLERARQYEPNVIEVVDSYVLKPVTKSFIEIGMKPWWFLRKELRGLRRGRTECKQVGYSFGGSQAVYDYPALLEGSDVICGGFGVSSLERCYLGIPSIGRVVAENQKENAQAQVDAFAAIIVPPSEDMEPYIALWLDVLSLNPDLVAMMSRKAMELVPTDSYGAFMQLVREGFM